MSRNRKEITHNNILKPASVDNVKTFYSTWEIGNGHENI